MCVEITRSLICSLNCMTSFIVSYVCVWVDVVGEMHHAIIVWWHV